MSKNRNRKREGVVYSTNPDFQYREEQASHEMLLPPSQQQLRVQLDKKSRGGKQVTLVTGFMGPEANLRELGKFLKSQCGVGGAAKQGQILIQGDFVARVIKLLSEKGYGVKKVGG